MTSIFVKRRNPVIETIGQSFLLLSFIAAILYGGGWFPASLHPLMPAVVKGCAVGFLGLFVLISMQSFKHFLLFCGLAFSTGGDIALAIPYEMSFLHGLSLFFIAHLIYCLLFFQNRQPSEDISGLRLRIAGLLWGCAAISLYFLYPHLQKLTLPVIAYTGILTLMATAALFSKYPLKLTALGAILFVVSDTLLGLRQFTTLPDFISGSIGYFVWGTYYMAQLLIALGVMLTDDRPTNFGRYRFD